MKKGNSILIVLFVFSKLMHRLADIIEKEGGISSVIFTHRAAYAEQDKWKRRFPDMERIIHA